MHGAPLYHTFVALLASSSPYSLTSLRLPIQSLPAVTTIDEHDLDQE
jgi:hypothetical protein